MQSLKVSVIAAALVSLTGRADAGLVFADDFDGENGGVPDVNYAGFARWAVIAGSVDLIGNDFADVYPGSGLYLDLDGTCATAGTLESTVLIGVCPGTYLLEFDLGDTNFLGGAPGTPNSMTVTLLDESDAVVASSDYDSDDTDPKSMSTQAFSFEVLDATTLTIRFAHSAPPAGAGDNYGLTIDDVRLSRIDDCAADLDADGVVSFTDLISILSAWGPCASCVSDLDCSGDVGLTDLITLLAKWGPCA